MNLWRVWRIFQYACESTCVQSHTYTYAGTCAYLNMYTQAYVYASVRTDTSLRTCIWHQQYRTYVETNAHTHARSHTRMHAHTLTIGQPLYTHKQMHVYTHITWLYGLFVFKFSVANELKRTHCFLTATLSLLACRWPKPNPACRWLRSN